MTRRVVLALAVAVCTVAGACTAGPSNRPPVVENDGPLPPVAPVTGPPATPPLPPLEEPRDSAVEWKDCATDVQERLGGQPVPANVQFSCGRVSTALDAPELPGRGIARINLLKAGTGPVPLVVLNDIDGEPGSLYALRLAETLPPELLQRFSLIGVDRRGSGLSDPVRCIPSEVRDELISFDPAEESVEPLLDAARQAGQQCGITLEDDQGAFDSWRTAGDLDEIRSQLGLNKLNALARGEGSQVLGAYAVRFTDKVGRFVLDGAPDPSPDVASVHEAQAAGGEAALTAFSADCAQRGCVLGGDAKTVVAGLLDQLRDDAQAALSPGLAMHAVASGLAQRKRWPELADAIAAARSGDGAKLAAFTAPLVVDDRLSPTRLDGGIATRCNDTTVRLSADQIDAISRDLRGRHPVFGGFVTQQLAWCSPWPVPTQALPPLSKPGVPPVLLVSTAGDPVTSEQGTARAAEQLPSGVRIGWQGAGHGAVGASTCVSEKVRDFLIDAKIPNDGTLCPA
ncbi:alpha/beta hydrolase [Amycolatopsis magusensis]|uniref:alpha/beta hydrolase n=1 Tax=Amycolatopsis magusensis TaxID=882444 RepID=UPI0037A1F833